MVRQGKHGAFFGCSYYPQCDYHRALKEQSSNHVVKVLEGQHCPLCVSDLVLRQGRFGMFVCCRNWPDCPHSATPDKTQDTAIVCPQCNNGHLVTRHSRFGKTFYACHRYPVCQFSVNAKPVAGVCLVCQYPLLVEKNTGKGVQYFCASKQCGKRQNATPDSENQ